MEFFLASILSLISCKLIILKNITSGPYNHGSLFKILYVVCEAYFFYYNLLFIVYLFSYHIQCLKNSLTFISRNSKLRAVMWANGPPCTGVKVGAGS